MSKQRSSVQLQRIGALLAAGLLGGFVGLAILLVGIGSRNRGELPRMEPEDFYAAERRWRENELQNYDVRVAVTGRQAAEYTVQVRDGEVMAATRNGYPLRQRRTMGTWSVPGMFGTICSDVSNLEKHRAGEADATTPQVLLRGTFHEQFGYPIRYLRTELRKWQNNSEVSWEVTLAEPVE